ncbi:undecaprenyl/decaprenyl-phosphate alpha-N-acetylglucosaminyl 1-phosphate transferase [Candidatus Uhrbacteria bacterium]|nr:undecaprenyl/decaprenyl-phosphate alpha-N-acetylglucosaminyl 1-phosphate transferase [Candidatus Uhrbacteria bacterium]
MRYFLAFIVSCAAVSALTPLTRHLAVSWRVLDVPGEPRKIHTKPTPLLGGLGVFVGLMAVMWYVAIYTPQLLLASITIKHLIGISVAGALLILGGYLDDKYNLKPSRQIVFTIAAALIIIASGIGIREITNPFGGVISLVSWEKVLFWWQGVGYRVTLPADLFTFAWIMGMMYTTKLLDGLDGLVSGMTVIGALTIFLLATVTKFLQPEVGMLAIMVAGAFAGFLFWNWHPAKIFLGTGGSTLAGFLLGILAIISGGKIATALLVLGVPVLDTVWVIARRILWERKSPAIGDSQHLHFRLLDAGFSQRGAVLLLWTIAAAFGMTTLFLQSKQKLIALGALVLLMTGLAVILVLRYQHRKYEE